MKTLHQRKEKENLILFFLRLIQQCSRKHCDTCCLRGRGEYDPIIGPEGPKVTSRAKGSSESSRLFVEK